MSPKYWRSNKRLGQNGRARQTMAEEAAVVSDKLAAADGGAEKPRQDRPDISHISGNDDAHVLLTIL